MRQTKSGIFLFNIIPSYRPGISKVFDYGFYKLACIPSLTQRSKQNTLYTSFENIAGESLNAIDLLYVIATENEAFGKINWVTPGSFTGAENGTVTFTPDEGITGDGATGYWDTQWNPETHGVNFTLDEAGVFVAILNECTAGNLYQYGVDQASTDTTALAAKYLGEVHRYGINSSTVSVGTSPVSSIGFFHTRRVADNDLRLFKDGAQVGSTSTQASTVLSGNGRTMALLAFNANGTIAGHSDAQVGMFGLGASLTGQESALYSAWNAYFSSL